MPKPNEVLQFETYDKSDANFSSQLATQLKCDSWEKVVQNCKMCDKKGNIINVDGKMPSRLLEENGGEIYLISPDGKTIVTAMIVKESAIKHLLSGSFNIGSKRAEMPAPRLSFFDKVRRFFSKMFKGFETDAIRYANLYDKMGELAKGNFPNGVNKMAERIRKNYRPVADNTNENRAKTIDHSINLSDTYLEYTGNNVEKKPENQISRAGMTVKKFLESVVKMEGVTGAENQVKIAKHLLKTEAYKDPEFVNEFTRKRLNLNNAGSRNNKVNKEIKQNIRSRSASVI